MKKLNKYIFLLILIIGYFSCEKHPGYTCYRIKNGTSKEVFMRFYNSRPYYYTMYSSFTIKPNENSPIFKESLGGKNIEESFISYTDSIDLYLDNVFVKRYINPMFSGVYPTTGVTKTPYDTYFYNTETDDVIYVETYTILERDFE